MRAPKDARSKRCMHQKDAFSKKMHALRRCMQQKDASTKKMHATKRCKNHGDTCNKEMQAQKMQAPKDVDIKEMHAQKYACIEEMHASKRCPRRPPCARPKDARVDASPRRCPRRRKFKKMPASTHVHEDARVASSQDTRVRLPLRASKRCPRRPRHTRIGLLACVQGMRALATSCPRPR